MGTFPLLILNNSAPLTTTTKAIVKIRIRTGTPRINSMYVLEIVLANLFLDILPMPEIKPRNNATTKDIRVDKKVIVRPGRIKLKALLYSGSE
jgi:hypothetical protein|tara:strand:+ start:539 stop:817 length:279 start_codon:yes stop_codon:yes gene_type:complete